MAHHHDVASLSQRGNKKTQCCFERIIGSRTSTWWQVASTVQVGDAKQGPSTTTDSPLGEAFKNGRLPVPPSPAPFWSRGGLPSEWTEVCGFVKLPHSLGHRFTRQHGAFATVREELGLSSQDQASHYETWIHLSLARTNRWTRA